MVGKKPWQRGGGRRDQGVLPLRRVLIVCEDEKSSRYYFEYFPIDRQRAEVVAVGTGLSTDRLVEQAIDLVSRDSRKGTPTAMFGACSTVTVFPSRTTRAHLTWREHTASTSLGRMRRLNYGTFSTSTTSTLGFQGGSTPRSSLSTSVTTKQTGAFTIV